MSLKGKIALVTGASSGIGHAIAERLISEGGTVVGCARREERLIEMKQRLGSRFHFICCDLRDTEGIVRMFQKIENQFGGIDYLINNAGLGRKAPLISGDTEAWREMLEVNVLGLSVCTREAVQLMRKNSDTGYIVHISSMAGHRVPGGSGMYSASKFAVRSLTEGLRHELRTIESGIRISAISPGFVETEFAEQYSGSKSVAEATYGRYKVLESADIAEQVVFLFKSPPHVQIHDLLVRPTAQPN